MARLSLKFLWVFAVQCSLYFNTQNTFLFLIFLFWYFRELQAASGEWINEYARAPRRDSITKEHLPASDIIKKSIRRSWTISSKEQNYHITSTMLLTFMIF